MADGAVAGDVGIAVKGEVGEVVGVAGAEGGHALGTVGRVAVVTGAVPAVQTGGSPIQLVFKEQRSQPAGAVQAAVVVPRHGAVVEIPREAEGIKGGHFTGQAGPPGVAVGAELARAIGVAAVLVQSAHHREQTGLGIAARAPGARAEVVILAEGVGADGGVHAPGGHFHAVKGQGNQQGKGVHVVHVGVMLIAVAGGPVGVVVEGAGPQGGQTHVFIELVAGGDAGHVIVEHGAAGGEAGQSHALETFRSVCGTIQSM